MKDSESAFPVNSRWDGGNESFDLEDAGMTLPQYAAIHLRVPCSGDPELDAAIRQSRRAEFAKAALDGMVLTACIDDYPGVALVSLGIADALLAEWEKEAERENISGH
jgi:hypothetical protein